VRRGAFGQREDAVHPRRDAALLEELQEGPHGFLQEGHFPEEVAEVEEQRIAKPERTGKAV
jgi:hypothetical protein